MDFLAGTREAELEYEWAGSWTERMRQYADLSSNSAADSIRRKAEAGVVEYYRANPAHGGRPTNVAIAAVYVSLRTSGFEVTLHDLGYALPRANHAIVGRVYKRIADVLGVTVPVYRVGNVYKLDYVPGKGMRKWHKPKPEDLWSPT